MRLQFRVLSIEQGLTNKVNNVIVSLKTKMIVA